MYNITSKYQWLTESTAPLCMNEWVRPFSAVSLSLSLFASFVRSLSLSNFGKMLGNYFRLTISRVSGTQTRLFLERASRWVRFYKDFKFTFWILAGFVFLFSLFILILSLACSRYICIYFLKIQFSFISKWRRIEGELYTHTHKGNLFFFSVARTIQFEQVCVRVCAGAFRVCVSMSEWVCVLVAFVELSIICASGPKR